MHIRYVRWLGNVLQGDFGNSLNTGRPTFITVTERLPITLTIAITAWLIAIVLAVIGGVLAAMKPNSLLDYVITTVAFLGISTPRFWSAIMLMFVFTFQLHWLPSLGLYDARANYTGWAATWDRFLHLVLPVTVMTFYTFASLTRYVRSSMLDVLSADYLRTARAKGLSERMVIAKHAIKNAAIPVVTVLTLQLPHLVSGSAIVESIFAVPGMGRLYVDSAKQLDYPILLAIMMMLSVLIILSNLLADILYAVLDPRIRYT
jgi:peptide/nickel transport system permease protein